MYIVVKIPTYRQYLIKKKKSSDELVQTYVGVGKPVGEQWEGKDDRRIGQVNEGCVESLC